MRWWTPARADGLLALVLTAFGQLNLRIHLDGSATYGPAFGSAVATATVALRYGDQSVEVDVRDTGRAAPRPPEVTAAVGHGLIGMRERVNLYAGTLTTGQSPDGGFAVRACLPVEAP